MDRSHSSLWHAWVKIQVGSIQESSGDVCSTGGKEVRLVLEEVGKNLELEQQKKDSGSPRASRPQGIKMLSFCCTSASQCITARAAINAGEVLIQLIRVWMRRLLQAASGPNEEPAEWLWCPPLDFGYHSWMREIREIVISGKGWRKTVRVHTDTCPPLLQGHIWKMKGNDLLIQRWCYSLLKQEFHIIKKFSYAFFKTRQENRNFAHCEHLHYKTKCGPRAPRSLIQRTKKKKERKKEKLHRNEIFWKFASQK